MDDFEGLTWKEQDSVISTLYESGLENLCFPMIERAYARQKAKTPADSTPLALFSMWQGIRTMSVDSADQALMFLSESMELCEQHEAAKDSLYPDLLLNLAELYYRNDAQNQASNYLQRASRYMSDKAPIQNDLYLSTLAQIVSLESDYGSIDTAEVYARRVLQFAQESFGESSIEYLKALAGVGQIYRTKGDLQRAGRIILQAYELAKSKLAPDDINRIPLARNAAAVQQDLGRTDEAEAIYEEMQDFFGSNSKAQDRPLYPTVLNQIGAFYLDQGDYEKAYENYHRANILFTLRTEKTDPNYIISQSNVADILKWQGQFVEAQQYYEDALQYAPQTFGENSWLVAHLHESLGDLHLQSGDLMMAIKHQVLAKDIFQIVQGELSPEYARSLEILGNTYALQGADSLAEISLVAAHDQYLALYGQNNYLVFQSTASLARFYNNREAELAKRYYIQGGGQVLYNLYSTLHFHLDEERSQRLQEFGAFFQDYLEFTDVNAGDASTARLAHEIAIALKTSIIRPSLVTIARQIKSPSESFRSNYAKWQSLRQQVINATVLTTKDRQAGQLDLAVVLKDALEIEKVLLRGLASTDRFGEGALDRIQRTLGAGSAYIDFYKVDDNVLETDTYYAFVLLGGRGGSTMIKLNLSPISTIPGPIKEHNFDMIWQPIVRHLEGVKTVVISPDQDLQRFAFHLIPTKDGKLLYDQYSIRYVSAGGTVPYGEGIRVDGPDAVVLGGALFDLNPEALMKGESNYGLSLSLLPKKPEQDIRVPLGEGFERIPLSIGEIQSVADLLTKKKWSPNLLEGAEANEAQLKKSLAQSKPSLLHIATHVFGVESSGPAESGDNVTNDNAFAHPLLHYGLSLAGANYMWRGSELSASVEDGLLSGMEIAALDLTATDLVVLHVAHPGEGTIEQNVHEAFQIAGADQVLISLWDTGTAATTTFLHTFYKNLLKGATPNEALKKTQSKLRKKLGIDAWGGFILVE